MTGKQKQNIHEMRRQGAGFSQIAETLGLSVNTVKSFCRRKNLNACDASNDTENKDLCKQCGTRLKQGTKSKPKTFCCDSCRYTWWNSKRGGIYSMICVRCGADFNSYDKNRKYCGHACYISARFGGEAHRDERTV